MLLTKKSIGYTEPSALLSKEQIANNYKTLRNKLTDTMKVASNETDKKIADLREKYNNVTSTQEKDEINNQIQNLRDSYNNVLDDFKGKLDQLKTQSTNAASLSDEAKKKFT